MAVPTTRKPNLPARVLPLMYFGFAHVCLGTAFFLLAIESDSLVGFFYHPRMIAVVHLVTLGWITGSILGAVYLIAPIALRMRLPARGLDYAAFAFFAIGTVGMVSHFWIDAYSGMLWSAATLLAGASWVAGRVLHALVAAGLPVAVKAHIGLACVNVLGAGIIGMLAGFEQLQFDVLPGFVLDGVYAHAHLAAVGWATMMVIGTGYRLFPMFLPASMPRGPWVWASALLLEVGVVGFAIGSLFGTRWTAVPVLMTVVGLIFFFGQVRWMLQHRKAAPSGLQRPDYGMGHALAALGFLALATGLGVLMITARSAEWELDLPIVYGVFGLLGFLGQMIVGMQARLLPMFTWLHAYAGSGYTELPPSPHSLSHRGLQFIVLILWLTGVPALALSLYAADPDWVGVTAWCMLGAVVIAGANNVAVLRHAFASRESARRAT